jgi:hypothetical protein
MPLKRRIDSNRTSSGSSGTSSGARPRELDDVGSYRSRTAASDVEDAAMLMGEAIGFALGYKIPAGEGASLESADLVDHFEKRLEAEPPSG